MNNASQANGFLKSKLFALLVLLLLIVVFFTIASKGSFFSLANARNILNAIVIVALLTIGAGALMISGQIDLSTGASGTMCGILMAILLVNGWPWPAAMAVALAAGGLSSLRDHLTAMLFSSGAAPACSSTFSKPW